MNFRAYQHVERLGTVETRGIEDGKCYIFPKLDGTNSSIWLEQGELQFGSRKRHLNGGKDNAGFMTWGTRQANIKYFFENNPTLRLFGEWLVPHSFKGYTEDSWRQFYIFDVLNEDGSYMPFDEYIKLMEEFELNFIPPMGIIDNPTFEQLNDLVPKNKFMVDDKESHGEGVVIKRYDYVNQFGRITWAKIVSNDFKESHGTSKKDGKVRIQEGFVLEEDIAKKYVTEALVGKEFAKIVNDENGWSSKYIPRLLNVIYYNVIKEESWNFIKANRDPTINFKLLKTFIMTQVKTIKSELF